MTKEAKRCINSQLLEVGGGHCRGWLAGRLDGGLKVDVMQAPLVLLQVG